MMGYENPYDFDYSPVPRRKANPTARRAMKLAGRLRAEGMNPSEALSEAWGEVRAKRNPNKGDDSIMDNMDWGDPMTLLSIGGLALVALRLFQGKWLWENVARAPLNRQLAASRQAISRALPPRRNIMPQRPVAAVPTDRSSIGDYQVLSQGGPLPGGSFSETVGIIGR